MSTPIKNTSGASRKTGTPNARNTSRSMRYRRRNTDFVTQRQLRGGALHLPSNPPPVSYQPWYPLTVVHSGKTGSYAIKLSDLIGQIMKQIDPIKTGLNTKAVLNVKIHRVRAWNLTGNMIALSVDDFSTIDEAVRDTDTLCGLVDTGSTTHIPAVGYDLPDSLKNVVLRNSDGTPSDKDALLYHIMCAKEDSIIVYTNVLWKFDGPVKISNFEESMMSIVRSISRHTKETSKDAERIRKSVRKLEKNSENLGIGEFLLDGAHIAAPYVLPAITTQAEERFQTIDERMVRMCIALENLTTNDIDPGLSLKDWVMSTTSEACQPSEDSVTH